MHDARRGTPPARPRTAPARPGGLDRRGLIGLLATGGVGLAITGTVLRNPAAGASPDPAPPPAASQDQARGRLRRHFLAAEEVDWDYAPSGRDQTTGDPFGSDARVFVEPGPDRIGRVYRKAVYRAYTDDTFATPAPPDPAWQHLGLLGPAIRAEVGDELAIVFRNNTRFPASVHAHGVLYDKANEGAPYADGTAGDATADDAVPPGGTRTYSWTVPERAGPGPMDPSSVVWMYHSHVDEVADTNAGLVGPIIVTRRGAAREDGSPTDVDREFVTLFTVLDENASPYLPANVDRLPDPAAVDPEDEGFVESNLMHAINGFVYGNLPGLTMRRGDRVRWYALALGTEVDLHTPHWHGMTLLAMGMRTDVTELLPGSMKTLEMTADVPGTWLFHCHVNDHITAGMQALFTIAP